MNDDLLACLSRMEARTREAALCCVAELDAALVEDAQLAEIAALLVRPSWGAWVTILQTSIAVAQRALTQGLPAQRAAAERCRTVAALSAALAAPVAETLAAATRDAARALGLKAPRLRVVADALTPPVTVRNRLQHGAPPPEVRVALGEPLRRLEAAHEAWLAPALAGAAHPEPWFAPDGGAFNGVAPDGSTLLVSRSGVASASKRDVRGTLQRFLGRERSQRDALERLLARTGADAPGVLLGDFLLQEPAGAGGFATVYRAVQLTTGRTVALKLLDDGAGPEARLGFEREAANLARFVHPHIVRVLGHGEEAWVAPPDAARPAWIETFVRGGAVKSYIALEWVQGHTLEAEVAASARQHPIDRELVHLIELFAQAASALAAVHAAGLVHRDVKPSNLMVDDEGVLRLMDFGIARSFEEYTRTGRGAGTPQYMAPEQLRALDEASVTPAADVYALCAVFYEVFTGARVFEHDRAAPDAVVSRKLAGARPRSPRELWPRLPAELDALIAGGLSPEPADRPASAHALELDLHRVLRDQPIAFRPPTLVRRTVLAYRRNRRVVQAVAASIAIVLAGGAAYVSSLRREQARTLAEAERAVEQRKLADARGREARQQLAAYFANQGREESARGEPARALAFLAEATRLNPDAADVRSMTAVLARELGSSARTMIADDTVRHLGFARGTLVSMGDVGRPQIWDVSTGQLRARLCADECYAFAVSPSGAEAATMDRLGGVAVHDVATGAKKRDLLVRTESGDPDFLRHANANAFAFSFDLGYPRPERFAWSPDGKLLAATTNDPFVQIFDATDGSVRAKIPLDQALFAHLEIAGETLLVQTGGNAALYDLAGKLRAAPGPALFAALSRDGHAAIAADRSRVEVRRDGAVAFTVPMPLPSRPGAVLERAGVSAVALSADGKTVVLGAEDCTVRVLDEGGKPRGVLDANGDDSERCQIQHVAVSPDGKLIAAAANLRVHVWNAQTLAALQVFRGPKQRIEALVFSPDSAQIACGGADHDVHLWPLGASASATAVALPGARPDGVVATASGAVTIEDHTKPAQDLEHTVQRDLTASFWSARGERLGEFHLAGDVVVSRDGQLVAVEDARAVHLVDAATGKLVRDIEGAAVSPGAFLDGKLVTRHAGERAKLWNLADGALVREVEHAALRAEQEEYRRKLATEGVKRPWTSGPALWRTSADGTLHIADLKTGQPLRDEPGWVQQQEARQMTNAFFVPGGDLVTEAHDGFHLWDSATGQQRALLDGLKGDFGKLFAAGNRLVVTGGASFATYDRAGRPLCSQGFDEAHLISDAALSPDGARLLVQRFGAAAELWDPASCTRSGTVSIALAGWPDPVTFDDQGQLLFAVLDEGVAVLSAQDGAQRTMLRVPRPFRVVSAAGLIAVLEWGGKVHLHEVPSLAARTVLEADGASELGFGPEGATLVTNSAPARLFTLRAPPLSQDEVERIVRERVPWVVRGRQLVPAGAEETVADAKETP